MVECPICQGIKGVLAAKWDREDGVGTYIGGRYDVVVVVTS